MADPPKKERPGKRLIFRWSIKTKRVQVIRAKGRPFPIWIDA